MAKKTGQLTDVTKAKQATTAADVQGQDSATRLWQSLSTTYGQKKDDTAKQYDLSKGAADRAAIQRGMGRSSYNLQTMANIDTEKAKALTQLDQSLIADYQDRLTALEQQERQEAFQREQFEESKSQYAQDLALKTRQQEASESQFKVQQAFQEKQWEDQKAQWREEFDFQGKTGDQKIAFEAVVTAAQQRGDVSDDLLKRAGLSRQDYEAMKSKASGGGGTPAWKLYGFDSKEAYEAYLAQHQQGGGGGGGGSVDQDTFLRLLEGQGGGGAGGTLGGAARAGELAELGLLLR